MCSSPFFSTFGLFYFSFFIGGGDGDGGGRWRSSERASERELEEERKGVERERKSGSRGGKRKKKKKTSSFTHKKQNALALLFSVPRSPRSRNQVRSTQAELRLDQKAERVRARKGARRVFRPLSFLSLFDFACSPWSASGVPSTTTSWLFPAPLLSLSLPLLFSEVLSASMCPLKWTPTCLERACHAKKAAAFFLRFFDDRFSMTVELIFFRDPCGCSSGLSLSDFFAFLRLKLTPFCTLDRNLSTQKERRVSGPKRKTSGKRDAFFFCSLFLSRPVKESPPFFHHACELLRERQQQARLRRCLCPWQRALDVGGLVL